MVRVWRSGGLEGVVKIQLELQGNLHTSQSLFLPAPSPWKSHPSRELRLETQTYLCCNTD